VGSVSLVLMYVLLEYEAFANISSDSGSLEILHSPAATATSVASISNV
jgi:hypothetical protein